MRMNQTLALLLLGLAGPATAADPPKSLDLQSAKITRINDGDSIEVQLESGPARVRLSAIDTPEFDQPYAEQASAALKELLPLGATVDLEVVTRDQFRRLVAVVWKTTDGQRININEFMLSQGHAWAYRRYMASARFCDLEAAARDAKLGLWAQPVAQWIYPPEWRFLKNGEIRSLPTPYEETRDKCVEVLKRAGAGTYTPPN